MKHLSLIFLLSGAAAYTMELDQVAMQEFLANKKQMVQVSEGKVDPHNPLFHRYVALSKLDEAAARYEYNHPALQAQINSFYNWLSGKQAYQTALATAKKENTPEAWDAFRKGNQPLIQEDFNARGIKPVSTSCADFFNANSHLSPEQIEHVVAQSFVIYHIRQLQRQEASIIPSAIQIK